MKGIHLKVIKTMYSKPTLKILNEKKMLDFNLLKSGMIQGCPLFPLHFCMVLEILAASIKHENEIYWIELGKRSQMSLMCKQYGIIYNRAKISSRKLPEIINNFRKVSGYKIHLQKLVAFMHTNKNNVKKLDHRHTHIYTRLEGDKISSKNPNQEERQIQ